MNLNAITSLTNISREKSIFFEEFFDWWSYKFNEEIVGKEWFMDETIISIYWTDEYNDLDEIDKKKLSYYEACQIIYTYSITESIFCLFLARVLLQYKFWTPEYTFIIREQIEEYRHQDMFDRTLSMIKSKHVDFSWAWVWFMKIEALHVFPKYFYILQVVIEVISGDFWDKCIKNKNVFRLMRDVAWIHEYEEKKHIAFAQIMLDHYFKEAWFISRTLGGWFVLLDIIFLNAHYIRQENFVKTWLDDPKKLYKLAKRQWKKDKYKNFNSPRWKSFMAKYWFVTWLNRWAFKLFLGFDWK